MLTHQMIFLVEVSNRMGHMYSRSPSLLSALSTTAPVTSPSSQVSSTRACGGEKTGRNSFWLSQLASPSLRATRLTSQCSQTTGVVRIPYSATLHVLFIDGTTTSKTITGWFVGSNLYDARISIGKLVPIPDYWAAFM